MEKEKKMFFTLHVGTVTLELADRFSVLLRFFILFCVFPVYPLFLFRMKTELIVSVLW